MYEKRQVTPGPESFLNREARRPEALSYVNSALELNNTYIGMKIRPQQAGESYLVGPVMDRAFCRRKVLYGPVLLASQDCRPVFDNRPVHLRKSKQTAIDGGRKGSRGGQPEPGREFRIPLTVAPVILLGSYDAFRVDRLETSFQVTADYNVVIQPDNLVVPFIQKPQYD